MPTTLLLPPHGFENLSTPLQAGVENCEGYNKLKFFMVSVLFKFQKTLQLLSSSSWKNYQ